jgi:DNA-binding transcriptional regulator YiaG
MLMSPQMIRGLRKRLSLSQHQFALRIGVTVTTVSNWENDRAFPQPQHVVALEKLSAEIRRRESGGQAN